MSGLRLFFGIDATRMARAKPMVATELEHTADIGFRVDSFNLNKLFEDAAVGLTDLIVNIHQVLRKENRKLTLSAPTKEDLMFAWLSELIYLFDGEHFLMAEAVVEVINAENDGLRLNAFLSGEKVDPDRHKIRTYVKAITLHQLKVGEADDGWFAEIYVDV